MGRYDQFVAMMDAERVGRATPSLTTSNATAVCAAEGFDVPLGGAPSPDWEIGQIVTIAGGGKTAYCRAIKRVTSPSQSVTLLPLQTTKDSPGILGFTFPSVSIISGSSVQQDALTMVIDLSDAPDGTYTYAIVAAGGIVGSTVNEFDLRLLLKSLVADPLGGAGSVETLVARWKNASTSTIEPFNFVDTVTLLAGQRYEFRLEPSAISTSLVELNKPRLLAIRYDTITEGSQLAEVTTASTSPQDVIALAALAAGDYLLLASWLQQCSLTGTGNATRVRVRLNTSGSNVGACVFSPIATTDYISNGFAAVVTAGASEVIKLQQLVELGSPTSKVKQARLMALPIPPGIAAMMKGSNSASGTNATLDDDSWNDLVDSGTMSFVAGTHIEFLQFGNVMAQELRPKWGPEVYEPERRGHCFAEQPAGAAARSYCNFFFHRAKRTGPGKIILQAKPAASVTSLDWLNVQFSALREVPILDPTHESPYAFACEVEPGVVYKKWTSVGTDVWQKPLPDTAIVTRVVVNGKDYAKVSSTPTVAETFYFDLAARLLTIKMLSGDSPADTDRTVMVYAPFLLGRDFEALTDSDGVVRPYEPRLLKAPSVEDTLNIRAEGTEVAGKFGNLEIASGGELDDRISQEVFDGGRIRVWRGFRDLHKSLREMQQIITAQMGLPSLKEDGLTIDVVDRSLILKSPIAKTTVSIYNGTTLKSGQLLPVIYGTLRRVPAYRTSDTAGPNTFQVCAHACKNIGKLDNAAGTFSAFAYADGTVKAAADAITVNLSAGAFTVANSQTDWQADILYVDVQGLTDDNTSSGNLLERAGEIARHLLLNYVAGFVSTQLVEASLRLLDRRWRTKRDQTVSIPLGVKIGLYLTEESARDALSIIAKTVFAYWTETRSGRIRFGVPDASAANLGNENAGFERDAVSIWPWRYGTKASSVMSTTVVFEGVRSLQLSNGLYGDLRRHVIIPKPGLIAITAMVSLQNGDGSNCRVAFISPHDGMLRQVSAAVQIVSSEFMRVSTVVKVEEGGAGTGTLLIIPYAPVGIDPPQPNYGSTIAGDLDASFIDATDGQQIAGTGMPDWDDRSDNHETTFQPTAGKCPTYVANAIAGQPAVLFDDKDDSLGTTITPAIPCTFMVAYAYRSRDAKNRRALSSQDVGSTDWWIGPYQNVNRANVGTSRPVPSSGAPAVDAFEVVVVTLVQTSATLSELFVNGVSVGTQTGASQVASGSSLHLGASSLAPGEPAGPLYMMRFLAWNSVISSNRRSNWEQFLMRKYGILPVAINIDNAEIVPVAASLEPVGGEEGPGLNVSVKDVDVRPDHYFAFRVPFNPNLQARDRDVGVIRGENEARGVIATYDPEASEAFGSLAAAGRFDLSDVIVSDPTAAEGERSARGIADPGVLWFGRMRNVMKAAVQGLARLPEIGDRVFHGNVTRIPKTSDNYPIWLITDINEKNDPASEVELGLERQIDPVKDRHEISPTEIPLGSIGYCLDTACPADYDEVIEQRTYYVAGNAVPNLTTDFGFDHHVHDLSHAHPLPSHAHTAAITGNLLGASRAALFEFPADAREHQARQPLFDSRPAALGSSSGDHGHVTSGSITFVGASGSSSTAAIDSFRGPNDIKNLRGLFCRRVRKNVSTIPATMIFGFVNATPATGWNLCDGGGGRPDLRGFALRGADPGNTGVSARAITSAHTQSDTANGGLGGTIAVDLTGINLHDRVTVTNGTITYHGRVTSLDVASFTCQPSHETNDSIDGSSYVAGGVTTITISSQDINTSFTPPDHLHVRSGANGTGAIPIHVHSAEHVHASASGVPTVGVPNATNTVPNATLTPAKIGERLADDAHIHGLTHLALPNETGTTTVQTSPNYGGTLTVAAQSKPPILKVPMIISGGSETAAPAGLIIYFDQSSCPLGYYPIDQANGRIIVGAGTGEGLLADDSGHAHTATYIAHAFLHRHAAGGAFTTASDAVVAGNSLSQTTLEPLDTDFSASGTEVGNLNYGHAHVVPVSAVQNVDPTLTQVVQSTGIPAGALTMPPNHRLRLCARS